MGKSKPLVEAIVGSADSMALSQAKRKKLLLLGTCIRDLEQHFLLIDRVRHVLVADEDDVTRSFGDMSSAQRFALSRCIELGLAVSMEQAISTHLAEEKANEGGS